jgi:hypothetical protein
MFGAKPRCCCLPLRTFYMQASLNNLDVVLYKACLQEKLRVILIYILLYALLPFINKLLQLCLNAPTIAFEPEI